MISAEKFLETMVKRARMDPKEIRAELEALPTDGLIRLLRFCQERAGRDIPRRNYGLVHQDIVNILGERLGFTVEFGDYEKGPDGVWSYDSVKIIVESKTSSIWLHIEQIDNYVRQYSASSGLAVAPAFSKDQIKAAGGFGNVRLLTTGGLGRLVELKEEGRLSTDALVKILVPVESVMLDYFIDVIYAIAKHVKPVEKPVKEEKLDWSYEELKRYLDDAKKRHKYTYAYYKVLSEIDGRISRSGLLKKMSEALNETVTGYQLAGVQAGITMTIVKRMKKERLDGKEDSKTFWLEEKYRELVRRYFRESGGS